MNSAGYYRFQEAQKAFALLFMLMQWLDNHFVYWNSLMNIGW
jgi:hypothetical protein